MEAMMYGKPVITNEDSDGTLEQVFDGVDGFVVKNADSFVNALRTYAQDPALREQHGQTGAALVKERFSVAAQRRAMEEALEAMFARMEDS
jgi:glycosyltransferase involved in cell wall biosynthesis